jgi:hypothetical protein
MVFSTKLAAAAMSGLLLAAIYTPASAWAGSANDATTTAASSSTGVSTTSPGASSRVPVTNQSLLGVLSPILTDVVPHEAQKRCEPSTLYSVHDVNGDPDACYLNRVNVPIL